MIEILSRLSSSDLPVVLTVTPIVLMALLVSTTILIVKIVQRHRELQTASDLVLEMLDRGIEPQEIAAVLKAMGLDEPTESRLKHRVRRSHSQSPAFAGEPQAKS